MLYNFNNSLCCMQICGFLNMHIPHTEFVDKLRHEISCGREGRGGGGVGGMG